MSMSRSPILVLGALLLCGGLSSMILGQTRPQGDSVLVRENTSLVTLTVSVADREGRAVTDLQPSEIEVYEDKVRQQIEFYSMSDAPVSVGVIFDLSGSMSMQQERARAALQAFIETSHAQDEYFLIGFQKQARLLSDFTDGASMLRRLAPADAHGATALYDALYLGIEKVKQGRHRKHVLLVISDGQDNASRYDVDELRRRMRESDVQIYCIGVNQVSSSDKGAWREERRGQMILDTIAQMSGGRSFFVHTPEALEGVTTRVALELRQQYSLGYVPTNAQADGRWRKIRVRLARPALRVRAREGYYATSE